MNAYIHVDKIYKITNIMFKGFKFRKKKKYVKYINNALSRKKNTIIFIRKNLYKK